MLADAQFRHDIALTVDAAGAPRGLEIRPHTPPGYAGCSAASTAAAVMPPPSALRAEALLLAPPVESVAIPVLPGGKGAPFAGQPEVTDADVLAAGSEALDAEGRAALQEQLRKGGPGGAGRQAAEPSFFQKYWHYILLGYALLLLNRGGGGGGGKEEEGAPRPAAGAPAAGGR